MSAMSCGFSPMREPKLAGMVLGGPAQGPVGHSGAMWSLGNRIE